MKQNRFNKIIAAGCLALTFGLAALLGVYDLLLPDRISLREGDAVPVFFGLDWHEEESIAAFAAEEEGSIRSVRGELQLLGIPIKQVELVSYTDLHLLPGGMPFGVKLYTDGVLVVGFEDVDSEKGAVNPAYHAGLRVRDVITHLDGRPLQSVESLSALLERGEGTPITITFTRGNTVYTATVTPVRSVSDGRFKTGMWVRDSGAGIGTVTFIDPTTGAFGGLGHGICDVDTGELMPMQRGTVVDVTINGVIPGACGAPGELRGSFLAAKRGALVRNTVCGVFGAFSSIPKAPEAAMPIALKDEIHAGEAYIWCTLDDSGPAKYTVELSAINKNATGSKCFTVKVTDPALIAKTGGIVQGMSGSPIIQDGKLIGAVTHVLINDPTTGYGIFIENMLDEMKGLAG